MLDRGIIGIALPGRTLTVDRSRLIAFARATGQTDSIYTSVEAAAEAGHLDLPVPPTFLFSVGLGPDALGWLTDLGVDLRYLLHAEQSFEYADVAHAGDCLHASSHISDVFAKRNGALQFIVKSTALTRPGGSQVADLTEVLVVREPSVS